MGDCVKVKNVSRKIDVLLTLIINIIFTWIYLNFFDLVYETNDDVSISILMEGAYGARSALTIFEHAWWGKFLVGLYELAPHIKWYTVMMYALVFLSFCAMVYTFLRMHGRKIGTIASVALLTFGGYQLYVIFQFSRIAMLATVGGMLLLFFALENASDKLERRLCIVVGALLALWGSMIRFQMFALGVALVGGALGIYRFVQILQKREDGWRKQIATYLAVFGSVGVLSLALQLIDGMYYRSEEWQAFKEYNELRVELYDYGFPNYYDNILLYEELGITEADYVFYSSGWNNDTELLPIESMQRLANAKPEKVFSYELFSETYPENFVSIKLFVVYTILSFLAIALNKKNIYYSLYGYVVIMAFEAYFFTTGRHGMLRVDYSMWLAAIAILLYGMADDLAKYKEMAIRPFVAALACVVSLFSMDMLDEDLDYYQDVIDASKQMYETASQDKEHLYVLMAGAPQVYFTFNFWEPAEQGELSNIYNTFGWDQKLPVKESILENYGIENIYRDSINNDKVYFISGTLTDTLQTYIQQNYDENAYLKCENELYGYVVWSIKSDQ